jgi:hypothetical protein
MSEDEPTPFSRDPEGSAPDDENNGNHPKPLLNYASPGTGIKLVTVATFGQSWEAHLAVGKLETEGIRAVLDNENMVNVGGGLYTNMTGGIKLKVAQEDLPRALAALPERVRGRITPCPKCGLTDTRPVELSPGMKMFCLCLLGLPYLFFTRPWICLDCNHLFKPPPPPPVTEDDDDEEDDAGEHEPK